MDPHNSFMALTTGSTASEAHPETMDFLSSAWCNFAVQTLHPELGNNMQAVLLEGDTKQINLKMEKSPRMDDNQNNSTPSWKSNDLKSWIWMQQAMHPELNYNGGFKKKLLQWKMPFGKLSIKKWVKEQKEKRKEEKRVHKAEVHAALSIAGLAAALASIAEDTSKGQLEYEPASPARKAALASAAALVASQCAHMAESMGAKRDQLGTVISSALSGTSTSDILTLTAAATTSLRGADTLKARRGCKNRLNAAPILPIDMDNNSKLEEDLNFEKCRSILAKGAQLNIEMADGRCVTRIISLQSTNEAKVMLIIMKRNMLNIITSKKQCMVLDQHAELYKDSEGGEFDTCYQIVLTTTKGTIKLDMGYDYQCYTMWATTINQMLKLAPSITKYEVQFCKY